MRYRKVALLFVLLLSLTTLLGMKPSDDTNLFYNTEFSKDSNGDLDNWDLTEGVNLTTKKDSEYGTVAHIDCGKQTYVSLDQYVSIAGDTNYCIRFRAKIVQGSGSVKVEISDYPSAQSITAVKNEWTIVELYGKTMPETDSIPISFVVEGSDTGCVVELAQLEFVQTDTIPNGATYVWWYDRGAWEAANAAATKTESIQGFPVLLLAMAVFAAIAFAVSRMQPKPDEQKKSVVWYVLGVCFLVSLGLSFAVRGHPTDITNFSSWAQQLAKVGIPKFYTSGIWVDYPPGYLYVLYVCGLIGKLFGLSSSSSVFAVIVKFPAILADMGCAYLIYRVARNNFGEKIALILCALMAVNPMSLLDSSLWGQIDSVLTLILAAAILCYWKSKKPLAAALLILGVLVKPQMLVFGPLFLVAYVVDIFKDWKKGLASFGFSILAGAGTLLLVALPFSIGQNPLWLWKLYGSASTLYPFATINAFNLYALLGMNWLRDSTTILFGLSASAFGTICITAVCVAVGVLYVRAKDKRTLVPLCGVLMWGIFLLAQSMHERYLFPAVLMFFWTYAQTKDRRFWICAIWSMAVTFLDAGLVLWNAENTGLFMGQPLEVVAISLLNLLGFGYSVYAFVMRRKPSLYTSPLLESDHPSFDEKSGRILSDALPKAVDRQGEKMVRWDYILMGIITLVYSVVALINLGSTEVPQTYWRPLQAGESALVDFGKPVVIQSCYYYPGVGLGGIEISPSSDGTTFGKATRIDIGGYDMYSWKTAAFVTTARYVKITALDAKVLINEMSFLDSGGSVVPVASVKSLTSNATSDPSALFDEQQYVNLHPDYKTQMYFDEVYHARTAFEHLHGFVPYENTHPPLGKVFIMLGIAIFGMNPFGWRIIGTLFGIGMLPLLYVFAKRIFRSTKVSAMACFLFAVDGMHFAQTRIATIDVYGVFFIIAMCYFMFRYWQMNFYLDGLKKTFVPLGWAGIMFGIGSASKWIGLYEGLGLAVVLFTSLGKRYLEYRRAKSLLPDATDEQDIAFCRKIEKTFWRNFWATGLFCVAFFIVIPACIYLASYLPYILCTEKPYSLKDVWNIQTYMYNYHSTLTATHPFQSPWYTWPLDIRPIYYFAGSGLPDGTMQAIAAFGNPAVWWSGFVAVLITILILALKRGDKQTRSCYVFILICLGAAYLPWTLITRATFIYHYFASVPFIILLTASFAGRRAKKGLPIWAWVLMGISLGLFALFYPVWSGLPISRAWALKYLRWMPSWWFFS